MTDTIVTPPVSRRLDAIDRKILTIVQENATLSVADIGDHVGLSATPCWKRIKRLEEDGIIPGRVALVDPSMVGLATTIFLDVQSDDHSNAWLAAFSSAVKSMPEIVACYRMAGNVDYCLRIVVGDISEFEDFQRRLSARVRIKSARPQYVTETLKSSTTLPIGPDAPQR